MLLSYVGWNVCLILSSSVWHKVDDLFVTARVLYRCVVRYELTKSVEPCRQYLEVFMQNLLKSVNQSVLALCATLRIKPTTVVSEAFFRKQSTPINSCIGLHHHIPPTRDKDQLHWDRLNRQLTNFRLFFIQRLTFGYDFVSWLMTLNDFESITRGNARLHCNSSAFFFWRYIKFHLLGESRVEAFFIFF